jgi:DNA-binding MarR family transcriptional regulator
MSKITRDIAVLGRYGTAFRGEKLVPFGLKAGHTPYLTRIAMYPGISQDKLAQKLFLNKSSVARQVAALEEDGFVIRKPSASDKRVMELYLTEKAEAIMPQIRQILQEWEHVLTDDLTEEETEVISQILAKMKEKAAAWMEAH